MVSKLLIHTHLQNPWSTQKWKVGLNQLKENKELKDLKQKEHDECNSQFHKTEFNSRNWISSEISMLREMLALLAEKLAAHRLHLFGNGNIFMKDTKLSQQKQHHYLQYTQLKNLC